LKPSQAKLNGHPLKKEQKQSGASVAAQKRITSITRSNTVILSLILV
jgi:hypothetical protein